MLLLLPLQGSATRAPRGALAGACFAVRTGAKANGETDWSVKAWSLARNRITTHVWQGGDVCQRLPGRAAFALCVGGLTGGRMRQLSCAS